MTSGSSAARLPSLRALIRDSFTARAKPAREQIKLRRVAAARGRLDVFDRCKFTLERGKQRRLCAALQYLAEERAALGQHFASEPRRRLGERHDAQVIGLPMAGGIRR